MDKRLKKIIQNNFHKIKKVRILCLGDLIIDHYVYGKVHRLSPEAPIPILLYEKEIYRLGGVGNVAKNILSLGASVTMISVIGKDQNDLRKVEQLKKYGKKFNDISLKIKNFKVPFKTRYINQSKQLLRLDNENQNIKLTREINNKIINLFHKEIKKCDIVLLSDYAKGFFGKYLIKKIIKLSKLHFKEVIIDPKQKNFNAYARADLITPNKKEISAAVGRANINDKNIINVARKIMKNEQIKEVLVTRSEKGMTLVQSTKHKHHKATTKKVIDVTGAGDTVVATAALMKAIGISSEDAIKISNYAAGKVVRKLEAASITLEELIT